jgi:hypothetical protein
MNVKGHRVALNLVRPADDKNSVKLRRTLAAWNTDDLASRLVNLGSLR